MRITEEAITKEVLKLDKINLYSDISTEVNYRIRILKSITGKVVSYLKLRFNFFDLEEEEKYKIKEIIEEFYKKFDLVPSFNIVTHSSTKGRCDCFFDDGPFSCDPWSHAAIAEQISMDGDNENIINIVSVPSMFLGNDLFITLSSWPKLAETPISIPTGFYYAVDKADVVVEMVTWLKDKIKPLKYKKPDNDEIKVGIAYRDVKGNLDVTDKYIKINDISLDQFEDELPNNKIVDELHKDRPGVIIFHGEPGCGKSSYIKYLIKTCQDKNFIIISQDLLRDVDSFRKLLLNVKDDNSVFIIEDCENLVKSRESGDNNIIISDFLNITDGIYGDLFKMKFILTFNTDTRTIDPALLRKGRLKCKYQFGKLKGDKLKALAKKLGIEDLSEEKIKTGMTLSDIFNYGDDNGGEIKKRTPIGF